MFASTVMVSIGTILSTTWIMAANSWMQTPTGYTMQNGQFVPTDWAKTIFNPAFIWRYPHMLLAVLIAAAFFVAGLAAYYLVKKRALGFAKRSLSIALGVAAILLPLQIFVGDSTAVNVTVPYQLSKLEAWEGNWTSTSNGYTVFEIPDQAAGKNLVQITIPWLGSAIGAKDLSGNAKTPGLLLTPAADRPNMAATFWGFRAMFYGSILMFIATFASIILRLRRRLYTARWFHKFLLWTTPMGIVSILGGWTVSEAGRQPWLVFGKLTTAQGVSHLAPGELVFSVIGFMALYLALLVAYIVYVVRQVKAGPERDDPAFDPGTPPEFTPLPGDITNPMEGALAR
jgi:cytochrome d ubiquinol oxidase subunit I